MALKSVGDEAPNQMMIEHWASNMSPSDSRDSEGEGDYVRDEVDDDGGTYRECAGEPARQKPGGSRCDHQ